MARSAAPQSLGNTSEPSIGDLVAQAIRDVTQLIKCEIDLAKLELRADARRLGLAVALLGIVAFTACLILVLLCFAFAYGLITLGIWPWAAFLIVAGVCAVLAVIASLIVFIKVRGVSGLRKTRESVHEDLALLKRDEEPPASPAIEAG
ncbi:MAG TPA: phage holin family protein [Streptosporangiaceae bacterium]|nr:phage holin family protein [Streptosporangiaceae bacterium]